jgi:hypothetical protein
MLGATPWIGAIYIDGNFLISTGEIMSAGGMGIRFNASAGVHTITVSFQCANLGGTSTQYMYATSVLILETKR